MEEYEQSKNTSKGLNNFPAGKWMAGEHSKANYQLSNYKAGKWQALYPTEKHIMNHCVL